MGAKFSSVNEGRTQVANATAVPSYNNKPSSNNNNRCSAPPSCATYPPNYKYNRPEYTAPRPTAAVSFPANATEANRVVAFHSTARWREYFEASKQSNKLIVIYFTATWCGPCKYMEPTIKELAAKFNEVEIVKIDVDELFNVSREFAVQAMPTFMFVRGGKQIDKVVGVRKEELQRKIENHRVY